MARGRTYQGGPTPEKVHQLKCTPDVWDIVRRICVSRRLTQWEVLSKYAKNALLTELRRVVREENAALNGEG